VRTIQNIQYFTHRLSWNMFFFLIFNELSVHENIQHGVTNYKICEMWLSWSNRNYCPNPVFARRNRGNPRKTPAKIAAPSVDVRMRDPRTRSRSVAADLGSVQRACSVGSVRVTFLLCVSCLKIDET